MKKILVLTAALTATALFITSCKKETTPPNLWQCTMADSVVVYVYSDTFPIIKTVNEFGFPVVCNCTKVN